MTSLTSSGPTRVFLDANIIAKPVTRTLLMVGGAPSRFRTVWSLAAEHEATLHMRPRAVAPALIRERFGLELTPSGSDAEGFHGTKGADRQILADAAAAGVRFLITEDVDDYTVIDLFVERQVNPPTTAARFHAAIAKNHPRLFSAHIDLYETDPDQGVHPEPVVIFRGPRCVRCEQIVADADMIVAGLCPECR